MRIVFLIVLISIAACKDQNKPKEYGSLNLNVYWKYNNFVGNRPDAGSEAALYSIDDSTLKFEGEADVRGDIKFDSVPVGNYVLIVISKSTKDNAYDGFQKILSNIHYLEKLCKCGLKKFINYERYSALRQIDSIAGIALELKNPSTALKRYGLYKDSSINMAGRYLDEVPIDFFSKTRIMLTKYPSKFDIQAIRIEKNRTNSVVVDFGITYL